MHRVILYLIIIICAICIFDSKIVVNFFDTFRLIIIYKVLIQLTRNSFYIIIISYILLVINKIMDSLEFCSSF